MGKIIELIKSFINPIPPEKSLDELALDAGIGEADLRLLKSSAEGINWSKFSREDEEAKTNKKKRVAAKEEQVRPEPVTKPIKRNIEKERDE